MPPSELGNTSHGAQVNLAGGIASPAGVDRLTSEVTVTAVTGAPESVMKTLDSSTGTSNPLVPARDHGKCGRAPPGNGALLFGVVIGAGRSGGAALAALRDDREPWTL